MSKPTTEDVRSRTLDDLRALSDTRPQTYYHWREVESRLDDIGDWCYEILDLAHEDPDAVPSDALALIKSWRESRREFDADAALRGFTEWLNAKKGESAGGRVYPAGPGTADSADAANPRSGDIGALPGDYVARRSSAPTGGRASYFIAKHLGKGQWVDMADPDGPLIDEPVYILGPISLAELEG